MPGRHFDWLIFGGVRVRYGAGRPLQEDHGREGPGAVLGRGTNDHYHDCLLHPGMAIPDDDVIPSWTHVSTVLEVSIGKIARVGMDLWLGSEYRKR